MRFTLASIVVCVLTATTVLAIPIPEPGFGRKSKGHGSSPGYGSSPGTGTGHGHGSAGHSGYANHGHGSGAHVGYGSSSKPGHVGHGHGTGHHASGGFARRPRPPTNNKSAVALASFFQRFFQSLSQRKQSKTLAAPAAPAVNKRELQIRELDELVARDLGDEEYGLFARDLGEDDMSERTARSLEPEPEIEELVTRGLEIDELD